MPAEEPANDGDWLYQPRMRFHAHWAPEASDFEDVDFLGLADLADPDLDADDDADVIYFHRHHFREGHFIDGLDIPDVEEIDFADT